MKEKTCECVIHESTAFNLEAGLREIIGGEPPAGAAQLLERYAAEIELFNKAYGLVGAKDRGELVVRHILDSLAPFRELRSRPVLAPTLRGGEQPLQIADVGSGAGLPGIPLAIMFPGAHFTLIERMGRRAGFLRNTIAVLGLANVTVAEQNVEQVDAGKFDMAVCRAFSAADEKTLRSFKRILKPDGTAAFYKGRLEKIGEEMNSIKNVPFDWTAVPCKVPFLDEERHIVFVTFSGE